MLTTFTREIDQCIKDTNRLLKSAQKHNKDDRKMQDVLDNLHYMLEICESENQRIIGKLVKNDRQYFRIDYSPASSEQEYRTQEILAKAPCLYPRHTVVNIPFSTTGLEHATEVDMCFSRFCKAYKRYKLYLEEGLAQMYLSEFQNTLDHELNHLTRNRKICSIRSETNSVNDQKYLVANAPWLYNARPEDYIKIINKYEEQYKRYLFYVNEIARAAKNEKDLTRTFLSGYYEAYHELNTALDFARRDLRSTGAFCTLGVVSTAVLAALNLPDGLKELVGTTTIAAGSVNVYRDAIKIRNIGSSSNYWIIWNWHRKTKKREKRRIG